MHAEKNDEVVDFGKDTVQVEDAPVLKPSRLFALMSDIDGHFHIIEAVGQKELSKKIEESKLEVVRVIRGKELQFTTKASIKFV